MNYVKSITIDGTDYTNDVSLYDDTAGTTCTFRIGRSEAKVKITKGKHKVVITFTTDKGDVTMKETTIDFTGSCCCCEPSCDSIIGAFDALLPGVNALTTAGDLYDVARGLDGLFHGVSRLGNQ